jgi:citrate lyase beta subunit
LVAEAVARRDVSAVVVRVNGLGSGRMEDDARAVAGLNLDAILREHGQAGGVVEAFETDEATEAASIHVEGRLVDHPLYRRAVDNRSAPHGTQADRLEPGSRASTSRCTGALVVSMELDATHQRR